MKVIVTYTEEADTELIFQLRSSPGERDDLESMTVVYLEMIRDYLIRTKGYPPDAVRVGVSEPPRYRMPFLGGLWIDFTVEDEARWFWRSTRTITIVHFRAVRGGAPGPL